MLVGLSSTVPLALPEPWCRWRAAWLQGPSYLSLEALPPEPWYLLPEALLPVPVLQGLV